MVSTCQAGAKYHTDWGVAKWGSRGGKGLRAPVNPGDFATRQEVCHEGPPTRPRWGRYHVARPAGLPGLKGA